MTLIALSNAKWCKDGPFEGIVQNSHPTIVLKFRDLLYEIRFSLKTRTNHGLNATKIRSRENLKLCGNIGPKVKIRPFPPVHAQ